MFEDEAVAGSEEMAHGARGRNRLRRIVGEILRRRLCLEFPDRVRAGESLPGGRRIPVRRGREGKLLPCAPRVRQEPDEEVNGIGPEEIAIRFLAQAEEERFTRL